MRSHFLLLWDFGLDLSKFESIRIYLLGCFM